MRPQPRPAPCADYGSVYHTDPLAHPAHLPRPMSIVELLTAYPHLFYASQVWFRGEAFTRIEPVDIPHAPPRRLIAAGEVPVRGKDRRLRLRHAVDLLNCYVTCPADPMWQGYLWTSDFDAHGQRIYLGGTANGRGMEIHRHLHVTDRWSVPAWD